MAMTDEQLEAFGEQVTIITERLGEMANALDIIVASQSQIAKSTSDAKAKTDGLADSAEKSGRALENKAKIEQEVAEETRKREASRESAQTEAVRSLTSFSDALLSTEKGFSKFSGSLGSAGDAAFELGKSFGGLTGLLLGAAAKAVTLVAEKQFEQADAVFKARNELFKFAGTGSITSNRLLDMAQQIGFTSKELDSFIKPLKILGPDLRALGNSAGEGVERFAEIGDVTKETREKFIRMGVMPEELLETQAEYIRLQRMSGLQLSSSFKTNKQLQDESLRYAENLKILSELTGEDAEALQKRAEAALNEERFQAKIASMQREAMELNALGRTTEAKELSARAENMSEQVRIAAQISPEMGEMARSLVVTNGAITDFTSPLIVAGVDVQKFNKDLQEGNPQASLNFLQDVINSTGRQVDQYGDVVGFLDDQTNRQIGITKGTMDLYTRFGSGTESLASTFDRLGQNVGAVGEGIGEGADPLANAQAKLITTQMDLAVGFDNLLQETSPLMNGFNTTTIAVTALATAAGVAAAALAAMAISRGAGAIRTTGRGSGGRGPGGRGPGGADDLLDDAADNTRRGSGRLGRVFGGATRLVGKAALPLAIGMAGYDAFKGFTADSDAGIGERFKNAGSSALSGASFGLLGSDPEEIAARAESPDGTTPDVPSARELRIAAEREDSNRRIQLAREGHSRSEIEAMMVSSREQSTADSESPPAARPPEETPNEIAAATTIQAVPSTRLTEESSATTEVPSARTPNEPEPVTARVAEPELPDTENYEQRLAELTDQYFNESLERSPINGSTESLKQSARQAAGIRAREELQKEIDQGLLQRPRDRVGFTDDMLNPEPQTPATANVAASEIPNEIAALTTPEAPPVTQTAPRTVAPAIETPTTAQVTAAITPAPAAQPTQTTTPVVTTTTTQANNANVNNDINDIMSLLSYKLDTVIDLLGAGVTIQDRILLESRS